MKLLLDFLCRFGWGMAAGLVLTPAAIVPAGFFRVNLLVVLGLATAAALVARGAAGASLVWMLAAAAAVVAWLGSVAWLGERRQAGLWLCGAAALLLAGATVLVAAVPSPPAAGTAEAAAEDGGGGDRLMGATMAAAALLSGLVSGLAVHAMLLGHWYLNAPGMRVDALRRMIDLALVAWGLELAWSGASLAVGGWPRGGATATALVSLRWLAGLVGLPILLVMARKTLDIPNTQSATGILYVACLAAILGELTAQLLQATV
ncbi:MAG: hypothetical protein ACKO1M_14290 [Planctomycetota bacterium]